MSQQDFIDEGGDSILDPVLVAELEREEAAARARTLANIKRVAPASRIYPGRMSEFFICSLTWT